MRSGNNYVYLHDLFVGTDDGAIRLGWVASIGIVATLVVTACGLIILLRSQATTATE